MKELIGKTIIRIEVSPGEEYIKFTHPDGSYTAYQAYGDCCSETWFADIVGVEALLRANVLEIREVDLQSYDCKDDRTRQEYDEFYGVKIKTSKGYSDIIYRNSSNGYYGGSISLYTGKFPNNMLEITSDWSA